MHNNDIHRMTRLSKSLWTCCHLISICSQQLLLKCFQRDAWAAQKKAQGSGGSCWGPDMPTLGVLQVADISTLVGPAGVPTSRHWWVLRRHRPWAVSTKSTCWGWEWLWIFYLRASLSRYTVKQQAPAKLRRYSDSLYLSGLERVGGRSTQWPDAR